MAIHHVFRHFQGRGAFGVLKCLLKDFVKLLEEFFGFLLRQLILSEKFLGVDITYGWVVINFLVHAGLGKCRFVSFVVPMLAEAYQVNDNVLAKFLPVLKGHLDGVDRFFGVISVYMENRCKNHLGQIGGVLGRTTVFGQGSKANLVIDYDMNRTAGFIGFQL